MSKPTPTPRTDAATYRADCLGATLVTNRDLARALETELAALTAERDQLRAALALGQQNCDDAYDDLRDERDAARARAERAEADAAAYLKRAESFCKIGDEAEAELATERARLDWLMAGGVCMIQHTGGFHVSRLHAPVSRAAIDAAMKEDAK